METHVNTLSTKTTDTMSKSVQRARGGQPGNKNSEKHGDSSRKRQQKKRRRDAIKGSTREGKRAYAWLDLALEKKSGDPKPSCRSEIKRWRRKAMSHVPEDTKEKIEAGMFYLWRALELRSYIVDDAKARGTPINRRRGTLPASNAQYDTAMEQWQTINDELQLDKGLDLARRLMLERENGGQSR